MKARLGFAFALLAVLFTGSGMLTAATIRVPADQVTIQAAIDVSAPGDTVVAAPGTYYENLNFAGKGITVTSEQGPGLTVIDGRGMDSVVKFASGEGRNSVLSGFTLQNGRSTFSTQGFGDGGGIWIRSASPTILNNLITNNLACAGVGISVNSGSPLIQGNTISRNAQSECSGGVGGGGISLVGGPAAEILQNVIENNTVTSADGAGISLFAAGNPTIRGNTIRYNTASGVSPCAQGGGISLVNHSDALIVNNLIVGNSAGCGGAISWLVPSGSRGPYLLNNTLAGNVANQGSSVYAGGFQSQARLSNNILVSTAATTALYCDGTYSNTLPVAESNNVFAPSGTAYGGICAGLAGVNGNISADPRFLNAVNDFHLLPASPAIDSGVSIQAPLTDIEGNPRPLDGNGDGIAAFDMGAYETPTPGGLPPATTAGLLPLPGAAGWNTTPVMVTLTSTGRGSAVKEIQYSLTGAETGGPFIMPGGSTSFLIMAEGVTTVTYFATDVAGHTEVPKTVAVKIDRSAPTTTASPSDAGWSRTNVAVTLTAEDSSAGSGGSQIQYWTGDPHIVSGSSASFTVSTEGATRVNYLATDLAGNAEAPKTLEVRIDKTAPTIAGMPAAGCTLSPPKHQMVQVAVVSVSDALSGVASWRVSATSNQPDSGSGGGDVPADIVITGGAVQLRAEKSPGNTPRVYTITAVATDFAGNTKTTTGTCTVPK